MIQSSGLVIIERLTVIERFIRDGRCLFSARAVVPLVMLPFVAIALPESWQIEEQLGERGSALVQWTALVVESCCVAGRSRSRLTAPPRAILGPRAPRH